MLVTLFALRDKISGKLKKCIDHQERYLVFVGGWWPYIDFTDKPYLKLLISLLSVFSLDITIKVPFRLTAGQEKK